MSAALVAAGTVTMTVAATSIAQAAVVRSIDVRGNQRVDDVTVQSYVPIKPGQSFSNADIDEGVKRLFATGLFSDVRVYVSGSALVIEVEELSVVNQVLFQGNRKVKDNQLLPSMQLQPRSTFSQNLLDADVEAIRQIYVRSGRSDVVIEPQVIDLGENRVNVLYRINEGDKTKIRSITFVGNNAYSDRRLRDLISTKQSNFLSFLGKADVYDEDRIRADEEALRRFYYNRGYADFRVISSTAELDEAANEYQIVFTVEEGDRYTFGEIAIDSTVEGVNADSLYPLLKTRMGKVYSAEDVEDTLISLTERVAGEGYAFANVVPRGDRDFTNRTISVTYTIDQGPRAYIERIEIRGNSKTRDYVIRREFDLAEGDAFNQVLIQRAKKRLEALDFFEFVRISTAPGSQPDRVVVVVEVADKSTGDLGVGAGYTVGGGNDGATAEIAVTERNFLGRGQFVKFAVSGGADTRSYTFSFTEPYFLGYRVSAGFDIYKQTDTSQTYDTERQGGTVRFGLPITNNLSAQLAYNYEQVDYTTKAAVALTTANTPNPILKSIGTDNVKSSVTGTLTYNTIDDLKNPRDGILAQFTVEGAGLGGDSQFVSVVGKATMYKTLLEDMDVVGLVTVGGGHIEGFGTNGLRSFDLFRNSSKTIRGFKANGFGPYDPSVTAPGVNPHFGSTSYVHGTAEIQFPTPLVPEGFGMRNALFADAASYFGTDAGVLAAGTGPGGIPVPATGALGTGFDLRASVGASIIWASPFGPLRLDYAIPVVKQPTDLTQNINFGIATRF